MTQMRSTKSSPKEDSREFGAYRAAELGFRNYWYPALSSTEVHERPRLRIMLGDGIVFLRRNGKAYAIANRCAHRGTSLALSPEKTYPFKGTNTITCSYHGWTYDVTNGVCVAHVTEGPDSDVPGKLRIRTYPVEERKGIVWIWMGQGQPVPVEEDVPKLLMKDDAVVKVRHTVKYGNWRAHAENPGGGHAMMVHQNHFRAWFTLGGLPGIPGEPAFIDDGDIKGILSNQGFSNRIDPAHPRRTWVEFPGLGKWRVLPWWRRLLFSWWIGRQRGSESAKPPIVHGILPQHALSLPGFLRGGGATFPTGGSVHYEWYVPVDADHYDYFQAIAWYKKNPIQMLWQQIRYYLWGKPTGIVMFNNGDAAIVTQTTDYIKELPNHWYSMARASKYDDFHQMWRDYCDQHARGVGTEYQKASPLPQQAELSARGGSE